MSLGLRIWIFRFGSQDLVLFDWVSGVGSIGFSLRIGSLGLVLRICMYKFGSQDLGLWVWFCGFVFLGLGLSIWIPGIRSQDLDLCVLVSGFGLRI